MKTRLRNPPVNPPVVHAAALLGQWKGLACCRLHESSCVHYAEYGPDRIEWLAGQLAGKRIGHNEPVD